MKTKAVIWKPNRTNEIVVPKKKDIQGRIFRHEDYVYFIDPECQQITEQRARIWKLWKKEYFATFYYVEGTSKPAPTPHFGATESPKLDANGKIIYKIDGSPEMEKVFPEVIDNGVMSEELAAIFNPWLYRILGHMGVDKLKQDIQFYLTLAIAGGIGYLIWQMIQMPDAIAEAISIKLAAPPTTVQP